MIRHFKAEDEEAVKKLFASGMMTNTNAAFMKNIVKPSVLSILGSVGVVTAKLTRSLVAALLVELLVVGLFYAMTRHMFGEYVKGSLKSDLSNINKIYVESGGSFLVATNPTNGSIVGIVGGEGKGGDVFELRRMSADPAYHGKGLATKLLLRLEKECNPEKMTLTTTSIMYAAHSLYRKHGFVLTRKFPIMTGSMRHFVNIEIYEFVKTYRGQNIASK